ncbi:PREDICTED: NAD-dependent protein deacetylase sirtuin-2-like isoform X1 [Branchiostoma belcheri]|uniref:NAD-dependent protein deacetylase sirtuin-2 n=1 Tax=Branchiostoma belcheri TaxID=7741 RepID=A0A6P5A3L2_BRABE|nr:PREDICTED: NAD-dependent protein deacetylase sirtuin-2-like isoform X1 [Branchiostoma belcheri]
MSEAEGDSKASESESAAATGDSSTQEKGAGEEAEQMEYFRRLFARTLGLSQEREAAEAEEETPRPQQLLDEVTVEGIAKYIRDGKCRNIIVLTGAGISTSAGIPDFRSPGTGLYDNLQKYNLPSPQAIFEIGFFKENPEPFFALAKELYPGKFKPTWCHYFIKLLSLKGLLLRNFTQNIDTLERVAGVPAGAMVEAHGTFYTAHCLGECRKEYTQEWVKEKVFNDEVPRCPECDGVVKPDIVFFGEAMPAKFFPSVLADFPRCDLLIVMGTSLQVQPFASLVDRVPETCPRLLINREKCGQVDPIMRMLGFGGGMEFDSENNYRDVAWLGDCDDGCKALAELLGWKEELEELVNKEHARIEAQIEEDKKTAAKRVPAEGQAVAAAGGSTEGASAAASPDSSRQESTAATADSKDKVAPTSEKTREGKPDSPQADVSPTPGTDGVETKSSGDDPETSEKGSSNL